MNLGARYGYVVYTIANQTSVWLFGSGSGMCKISKERFSVVGSFFASWVGCHWSFHSVSQFTLLANTKKGTRPDFHGAMAPDQAKYLYEYFFKKVQQGYNAERVKDGVFQAMMEVALVNDGPVSGRSSWVVTWFWYALSGNSRPECSFCSSKIIFSAFRANDTFGTRFFLIDMVETWYC